MPLKFILVLAIAASAALGHMELIAPCPRYSSKCATKPAFPTGKSIDYDLNSAIGSNGQILAPLCKHTTPWPQVTETWIAGQPVTVLFNPGGATHSGGHCEFSLSYDGGSTYVVVYQVLRYCFFTAAPKAGGVDTVRAYTFALPADLPGTRNAIFSWTWVNAVGNREFYNNCGDIAIRGPSGSYTGKKMTVVNYGPAYPVISEFFGDYETGIQHYTTNTTNATVSGSGYAGGDSTETCTTTEATATLSAEDSTAAMHVSTLLTDAQLI